MGLFPETLSTLIAQDLSDGWIAGLVGSDGRRIARSKNPSRFIGTSNPRFLRLATGAEGTWVGHTDEGIRIAGGFRRSPLSGWIASVAVPEADLTLPLRHAFWLLMGLSVLALALSVCLGWWLSRRIAVPMSALAEQARGLAGGVRLGQPHSAIAEVSQVSEALEQTSLALQRAPPKWPTRTRPSGTARRVTARR